MNEIKITFDGVMYVLLLLLFVNSKWLFYEEIANINLVLTNSVQRVAGRGKGEGDAEVSEWYRAPTSL